jgi:hypothetical protein
LGKIAFVCLTKQPNRSKPTQIQPNLFFHGHPRSLGELPLLTLVLVVCATLRDERSSEVRPGQFLDAGFGGHFVDVEFHQQDGLALGLQIISVFKQAQEQGARTSLVTAASATRAFIMSLTRSVRSLTAFFRALTSVICARFVSSKLLLRRSTAT